MTQPIKRDIVFWVNAVLLSLSVGLGYYMGKVFEVFPWWGALLIVIAVFGIFAPGFVEVFSVIKRK